MWIFHRLKSHTFRINKASLKMITRINWLFFEEKLEVFSVTYTRFKALNKPFFDESVLFLNGTVKKFRSWNRN